MDPDASRHALVSILRHAFSGERAAGYAYRGHWRSLTDPAQRERVRAIEDEEWHHRRLVGEMLTALGARPDRWRELRALVVGRALGALCHASGWFAPMYGAGRLESGNIKEYEDAARHAARCGRHELVDCLLSMAEVEWEHERYFRSQAQSHRLSRYVRLWPAPPPKEAIRAGGPRAAAPGPTEVVRPAPA
jgi:demethoxyubiquinone hydroxylase (CLK1/Coq7/Cat5 family)